MTILHFEITPSGRVKFNWEFNDTRLEFYNGKNGRSRKVSTIEEVGQAFIEIAKKAREIGQFK